MANEQMSLADESAEYAAFVEKFKPKKTTDDCYTPQPIYDVVLDYVVERYGIDREKVVRPFWPGGDFEREEYPDGCCVVDNPPFSLLARIIDFYMKRGVKFFLFAPTLTCLSHRGSSTRINHIACHTSITYENGAKVNTSFVTNLDEDGTVLESDPALCDLINDKDEELQKANKKSVPKYVYPDNIMTAAKCQWFAAHHTPYRLNARDCIFVSKIDAMGGKGIFGGGLLLNTRAAAERAAAERAAAERAAAHRWELSEREKRLIEMMDKQAEKEGR